MKKFFTSESVTEGHPDKLCDQIADAVLDAIIAKNSNAHVACEVCATTGLVLVMGEVTDTYGVNISDIVRDTIKDIGYDDSSKGFDYKTCAVMITLDKQSSDIAQGVNKAQEHHLTSDDIDLIGAGDQGMMFGYACRETEELMPLAITLAHALTSKLTQVRKSGLIPYLRPDGKAQVTVEYTDGVPTRVDTVVLSSQHSEDVDNETLRRDIFELVIKQVIPANMLDDKMKVYINPTGRFVIGGPNGDSGLTGRKIIVDTYGGYCAHGGGALSGKDPTKVDRSAMYMARYICKNVVASGLADKCELEVAYAIGRATPVSMSINTYGTGKCSDEVLCDIVSKVFDVRPMAIIRTLKLDRPIYQQTSNYGHFGRSIFTWETTDKVEELQTEYNKL